VAIVLQFTKSIRLSDAMNNAASVTETDDVAVVSFGFIFPSSDAIHRSTHQFKRVFDFLPGNLRQDARSAE
jgi:hypothetical protein